MPQPCPNHLTRASTMPQPSYSCLSNLTLLERHPFFSCLNHISRVSPIFLVHETSYSCLDPITRSSPNSPVPQPPTNAFLTPILQGLVSLVYMAGGVAPHEYLECQTAMNTNMTVLLSQAWFTEKSLSTVLVVLPTTGILSIALSSLTLFTLTDVITLSKLSHHRSYRTIDVVTLPTLSRRTANVVALSTLLHC